jgi:Xaa-Pro aminopeptidase
MLSGEGCRTRRKRLWDILPKDIQWVLIADPRHVNYLSGFWVNPLSASLGERGLLYLERGGESILLVDNFALASAVSKPFVDRTVMEPWYDQWHSVPNRDHALFKSLERIGDRLRASRGVVEAEWFPLGASEAIRQATPPVGPDRPSLGTLLRELRRVKDPDELELIRRCIQAGETGQRRGRELAATGIGELELYREVQSAVLAELGCPALVYGDFRAASPSLPGTGGPPTDYALREGDTFILDFSVVLAGYRSDITSTIAVGEPTQGQRELHALCLAALASGEAHLKAGASGREVYQAVAAPFAAASRPELFPHHAGHGLGLGHPEAPAFVPESDEVLCAGEVVTLEPGAYLQGVGGVRIEHNYLVTKTGCMRLSRHETALTQNLPNPPVRGGS